MRPSIFDILEGLRLKENPNAILQFFGLILVIVLFVVLSKYITKRPKILRKKQDIEAYNFIIGLKRLDISEKNLVETMITRYNIKDKYNLLIMEGKFQKYMEMEIINVEQSPRSTREKEVLIENYKKLKQKIFDN